MASSFVFSIPFDGPTCLALQPGFSTQKRVVLSPRRVIDCGYVAPIERHRGACSMLKTLFCAAAVLAAIVTFGPAPLAADTAAKPAASSAPSFTVCKSTYALCTTAACTPIAGQK